MLHMYELIENNTVLITEVLGIGVNIFCHNINLFSLKHTYIIILIVYQMVIESP